MKIKRTYKDTSLKHGHVEIIDDVKMCEIAKQTDIYDSTSGELISQSGEAPALMSLSANVKLETFFSKFELISL